MDADTGIAIGISPEEGKFCVDCKHLIRHNPHDVDKWNCGHPNNASWGKPNLITGIKERKFKYPLQELRYALPLAHACGLTGLWYEYCGG